jgi:hypothetical protein
MLSDRRLWTTGLLIWVAAACGGLGASEEKFAEVPSGASIAARLASGVNSNVTRPGQTLTAIVSEPIVIGGDIVIPADAVLSGTVTAISQKPPSMTIEWTEIETVAGTLVLTAKPTIVRLAEHSEMKDEAAKIGGGAAAGAIVGGVVGGNVKGAAIGAAAGAAAGTGVALATKERYAYLPAGSQVSVQLAESLSVPVSDLEDAGETAAE